MEEDIVYLKKIIEYFKVGIKIEFGNKDIEKLENLIKGYREKEESEKYLYEAYQDAGKKMFDYAEELEQLKKDFEIVDHECSRLEQEDIKKDKIIELMAEKINQAYFEEDDFEEWFEKMLGVQKQIDYGYVVDLIKQYFERKIKKCVKKK